MSMRIKVWLTVGLLAVAFGAAATDIYVDFERGSEVGCGEKTAPLRNFPAALKKAEPGDTIFLLPATGPVNATLAIRNKKGLPGKPIIIDGMFNTMSGVARLTEKDCKEVSPGLFLRQQKNTDIAFELRYFLCFDGQMQRMDRHFKWKKPTFKSVGELQPGEWTMVNATEVYFKLPKGKNWSNTIVEEPKFANGVQIDGNSEHLVIRNLIVRSFWNDGCNIHGNCRDIHFENIAALYNFDDGISAHETCQIFVKNFVSIGNGTGFCHVQQAECHHENIYIAACEGRDILTQNRLSTMRNIIVEGSARGLLEFAGVENTLENCLFLNLRLDNSLVGKKAVMKVSDSWYCDYAVPVGGLPAGLKHMGKTEITAKIKQQRDALLAIFGGRVSLPSVTNQ